MEAFAVSVISALSYGLEKPSGVSGSLPSEIADVAMTGTL